MSEPQSPERPASGSEHGSAPAVPLLEARSIEKRFGGVRALRGVSVTVDAGTVHALVGENGAGKSTLGRIMSGVVQPDGGELLLEGRPVRFPRPRDAQRAGVAAVSQELTLVPQLSVIQNVFLGVEERQLGMLTAARSRRRYAELVERTGLRLPPDRRVGDLSVADRQKVEILRALGRGARLVVLDEPTAALVADEVRQLLAIVRQLVATGTTIVFVSHALADVLEIADTVTVMRDGGVVETGPAAGRTPNDLATAMLGRPLDLSYPEQQRPAGPAAPALAARNLGHRPDFSGIDLELRPGEILGLAGLVDSGAAKLAAVLAGVLRPTSGEIFVGGQRVRFASPRDAIRHGISLLPESRRDEGLFMRRPIRENVTAGAPHAVSRLGMVRRRLESSVVVERLREFDVKMASIDARVDTLSGGNQQKVLLGKSMFMAPRVLVAMQPTRGVDVGAKSSMYRLLTDLAAGGTSIVVVSPEIEEVHGLAHRILVLYRGRITAEVDPVQTSYDDLMHLVLGAAERVPAGATAPGAGAARAGSAGAGAGSAGAGAEGAGDVAGPTPSGAAR